MYEYIANRFIHGMSSNVAAYNMLRHLMRYVLVCERPGGDNDSAQMHGYAC